MKALFTATLFLFLSNLIAQAPSKDAQWLAPASKPKTYGLNNSKGEVAVEAKYDLLQEGDGTGWIALTAGKYGVVNSSGSWLIKPNFEIIVQFLNGKAVAGKKTKTRRAASRNDRYSYYNDYSSYDSTVYFGVIDASGVWVIEPQYDFIRLNEDGSAQYADSENNLGYLNPDGSIMIRAQYIFATQMNGGAAVVGEPASPTSVQRTMFDRGHFQAGDYFVIDRTGNKLNPEAYPMIRAFKDGRAAFNKGGLWKNNRHSSELKLLGGKWGFLDASGKEIIEPVYDYVYDFVNGKAKVRSGQRIFWIDADGKETQPPLPVKNENTFSIFCAPGFYGYIDAKGKYVIEPQFFVAKEFSEGLAAVMPLRASDMNCDFLPATDAEDFESRHHNYSRKLNFLLNLDRDYGIDFDEHTQQLMDSTRIADSIREVYARRLYGYTDASGNMVLPAKYDVALPFHNGRAYVMFRDKWGVIDKKGNWIFAPVLEWPDELSFIKYSYGNDGRQYYDYGYNDSQIFIYDDESGQGKTNMVYAFNDGIGCIYKYGQYGFIDTTGKIIAAPVYDEVKPFVNGFAAVRHGYYWGYIDKTGKEAIPLRYKSAGSFSADGLACVGAAPKHTNDREQDLAMEYENDNSQYFGYIDRKGNWAIKPQFTDARDFSNGLAAVSLNYEKSGYIDKTGKFVIPPKYNYAGDFEYGFALVRINMFEAVYIDKSGKVSKTITAEHPPKGKSDSSKPKLQLGENNYYGYVNDKGERIIPYEFSKAGEFSLVK
jgi:hypothetical protein